MADAEALQLASLSSSTPPSPTPAASSSEPLFVDDCRGCTRLLDVRCAGYTRALMFHHKLVDCILPQYVPLMEQLEKAAQEGGTTCILSDADVMHPYLEALLPAARPRLRVRLVGNGSTHRPLALNATPGCGALPLSPVQRVQPLGLKDYVCHDCTKGCHALVSDGTLTRPLALAACTACERGRYMPSGGTCVSTFPPFKSGQLVAELRTDVRALGIQSPWRTTTTTTTLAAAAAATAVASDGVVAAALGGDGSGGGSRRQMILLVARRSTVWSNTYNGTAARSWTEESRLALRRALEAVPGAQVEELTGAETTREQLRLVSAMRGLVGVHGAALSYAPFAPNSLTVVELGTFLNWKYGKGEFEWRSSGFITHWSPTTIDWILYRLPPQDFVPEELQKGFFSSHRGQAGDGSRLEFLVRMPFVRVNANHAQKVADNLGRSWAWRNIARAQLTAAENKSKHMVADALVDCQPVPCHVKREQKIVWFTG